MLSSLVPELAPARAAFFVPEYDLRPGDGYGKLRAMSTPDAQPTALIVADSHFHLHPDAAEKERVGKFCKLMDLASQADHLILLGDIFDFWFDYPHFRLRGYEEVLQALDRVVRNGTMIHFIGGNHDIWAAAFMHERYGCEASAASKILTLGGTRLWLTHGDGLLSHDWVYNTFRAMVRTRLGIVLAKSLHPEILYAFSEWLSGTSRGADRDEAHEIEAKGARWIEEQKTAEWDLAIMGHVHHAFSAEAGGRSLHALAGWFESLGYAVWREGRLELLDFDRDPLPTL
jgi:UDP-2,3-diacylglucosamine hydrolase